MRDPSLLKGADISALPLDNINESRHPRNESAEEQQGRPLVPITSLVKQPGEVLKGTLQGGEQAEGSLVWTHWAPDV